MCVWGIDFISSYNFLIVFWNCSHSFVFAFYLPKNKKKSKLENARQIDRRKSQLPLKSQVDIHIFSLLTSTIHLSRGDQT